MEYVTVTYAPFTLRMAPYVDALAWTYVAVHPRASMYSDLRHRASTQYTADTKL